MNTTPGSLGYRVNPIQLMQTFGVSADSKTALDKAGSALEGLASVGVAQTAVTKLTGTDFTKDMPSVTNADQFGDRAGVNVDAAATVGGKGETLDQRRESFRSAVTDMQRPLQEALSQGAENLGYDQKAADASYMPIVKTEMADMAVDAGMAKVGLQAVAAATSVADGINDVRSIAGKLTPLQEAKLADQMRTLLTPTRDPLSGEVTAPPAIANNLDQDFLENAKDHELVQLFKQALLPPEDQPEWKQFMAAEAHLEAAASHHGRESGVNDAVLALADATGEEASIENLEADATDRILIVSAALDEGVVGAQADAAAVGRLNISALPPEVRAAIISGGLDKTDSPESGGLNRESELLELARAGAAVDATIPMGA